MSWPTFHPSLCAVQSGLGHILFNAVNLDSWAAAYSTSGSRTRVLECCASVPCAPTPGHFICSKADTDKHPSAQFRRHIAAALLRPTHTNFSKRLGRVPAIYIYAQQKALIQGSAYLFCSITQVRTVSAAQVPFVTTSAS